MPCGRRNIYQVIFIALFVYFYIFVLIMPSWILIVIFGRIISLVRPPQSFVRVVQRNRNAGDLRKNRGRPGVSKNMQRANQILNLVDEDPIPNIRKVEQSQNSLYNISRIYAKSSSGSSRRCASSRSEWTNRCYKMERQSISSMVGRGGPVAKPPDLNPCDFFLYEVSLF